MSLLKLFFLICAVPLYLTSCSFQETKIIKHSDLFLIKQNGKFGYIDKTGKFVWNPSN